ncbi:Nmad5 family putative nucleotide modification protein [Microbulbifer agarilyticus]
MTIRLNSHIRESIVDNAITASGIPERKEALRVRRAKWAEACRIDALGGELEAKRVERTHGKIKKLLAELPDSVVCDSSPVRRDYDIYLNIAGCQFYATFSGVDGRETYEERVIKISPHRHTLTADHPLAKEFQEIEKAENQLRDEEKTIRHNVKAAVSSVRSVKKLTDMWPEVKELLPSEMKPAIQKLPAVLAKDLNAMIGLPTGT